jgi:hypothetical protein
LYDDRSTKQFNQDEIRLLIAVGEHLRLAHKNSDSPFKVDELLDGIT